MGSIRAIDFCREKLSFGPRFANDDDSTIGFDPGAHAYSIGAELLGK